MNETDKDREILFFSLFRSLFLDLLIDITFKLFIGGFGLLHQYCNRCNDDYKVTVKSPSSTSERSERV